MSIKFIKIRSYLKNKGINIDSDIENDFLIDGVGSLKNSTNSHITFFNDSRLFDVLKKTKAKGCLINIKNYGRWPAAGGQGLIIMPIVFQLI